MKEKGNCPRCGLKLRGQETCKCFTLLPKKALSKGKDKRVTIESMELYLHTVLVEQLQKYDDYPTIENGATVIAAFSDLKEYKI